MDTKALTTRDEISSLAQIDPATAWIYAPSNRIAIDNENRNGFIVKGTDEKVEELAAIVQTFKPLHSHKQPDEKRKNDPRHASATEWCESYDNRITNTQGVKCADCPAFENCKWKLELTLSVANREGDYLLTIPSVSSMRFREKVNALAKNHKRHFSEVIWKMTVSVEKSSGNSYPVVAFAAHDPATGEMLNGGHTTAPAKSETDVLREKLQSLRAQVRAAGTEPPAMTAAQAAAMNADQLKSAIAETMSLIRV